MMDRRRLGVLNVGWMLPIVDLGVIGVGVLDAC